MAKKLFVGNLAWSVTDESLANFFGQVGKVVSARVVRDKYSDRSKGFGFVEMSTDAEAEEAKTKLNKKELEGRPVNVSDAREQPAVPATSPVPAVQEETEPQSPKTEEVEIREPEVPQSE